MRKQRFFQLHFIDLGLDYRLKLRLYFMLKRKRCCFCDLSLLFVKRNWANRIHSLLLKLLHIFPSFILQLFYFLNQTVVRRGCLQFSEFHERFGVLSCWLFFAERKLGAALHNAIILFRHWVAVCFHLRHDLLPNAFHLFHLFKFLPCYYVYCVFVRARLHIDWVMFVAKNLVFKAS